MGTINQFYHRHGREGLAALAKRAGTKLSYLQQLNYTEAKRPSMQMAQRLVEASGGELTLDGLANPKKRLVSELERGDEKLVEG